MNLYGVIYKITDPAGKSYIGQHKGDGSDIGRSYLGRGKYITLAIKKHGTDYFTYKIVEKCFSKEKLNELECYYIKHFNTISPCGYNLTHGGDGGDTTENFSEEQNKEYRKKLCEAGANPVVRKKRSNAMKEVWTRLGYKEKQSSCRSTWANGR